MVKDKLVLENIARYLAFWLQWRREYGLLGISLAEGRPAAPGVRRGLLDTVTELTCKLCKGSLSQGGDEGWIRIKEEHGTNEALWASGSDRYTLNMGREGQADRGVWLEKEPGRSGWYMRLTGYWYTAVHK